jgi:hypothetical protein
MRLSICVVAQETAGKVALVIAKAAVPVIVAEVAAVVAVSLSDTAPSSNIS